jgi:hypothetical protein
MHVEKARIERKGRKDLVQSSPLSFKNTNNAHVSSHVFIFDFNRKVDPPLLDIQQEDIAEWKARRNASVCETHHE